MLKYTPLCSAFQKNSDKRRQFRLFMLLRKLVWKINRSFFEKEENNTVSTCRELGK